MDAKRRQFLKNSLFGAGYVGLQSLATGLPISVFTSGIPRNALAMEPHPAQFLVLMSGSQGDPFNANTPGSYGYDGVTNNPHPEMAPTDFMLGDRMTTAAAPWATLPEWAYNRTTFIHHRTYQNAHPQYDKVMGLVGSAKGPTGTGSEHVASLYSSENAAALDTVQIEPVSLDGGLSFEGRSLQQIRPRTLASLFRAEEGNALRLQQLRQQKLDEIHQLLRESGTPDQRRWLDRHASSHEQIRSLDESLLATFSGLEGNDQRAQVDAAIGLIRMKISPVIRIQVDFGGDNHNDRGLVDERDESVTGIATIAYLLEQLEASGLRDNVTVANLHVFGRTLGKKGTAGRDHNLNHHVMMISGSNVRASVVGSIARSGNDFGATGIDSVSGEGGQNTDIPPPETLEAAAKTLGTALGVPHDRLEQRITGGRVIRASVR